MSHQIIFQSTYLENYDSADSEESGYYLQVVGNRKLNVIEHCQCQMSRDCTGIVNLIQSAIIGKHCMYVYRLIEPSCYITRV